MNDTALVVRKCIAEMMCRPLEEVQPSTRLREDLGADSLDVVETVMEIEDQLDRDIPDTDVTKLETVQHVIDYVAAIK